MAEYSGYMYPSTTPLPNIYRRPKPKLERANSTSKTTTTKSKTSRFRHHRTSSSSESASRSSHETSTTTGTSNPLLRQATVASTTTATSISSAGTNLLYSRGSEQGISAGSETRPPAANIAAPSPDPAVAAAAGRRWSRSHQQWDLPLPDSPRPYLDAGIIPTGTAGALPPTTLEKSASGSSSHRRVGSGTNNDAAGASTATGPPSKQPSALYLPSASNLYLPSHANPSQAASVSGSRLASLASAPPYGYSLPPLPPTSHLNKLTNYSAEDPKHVTMPSDHDVGGAFKYSRASAASGSGQSGGIPFGRTESTSSASGTNSLRSGTMSGDHGSSFDGGLPPHKPFIQRSGRTYLNDPSLAYPLPVDLTELHRQSLRTLLLIQVFGGPVCSPSLATKPPLRVLEVGCGSGFWSMMCHRYFAQKGHANISFTGIDVAPLAPGAAAIGGTGPSSATTASRPEPNMKWRFVRHDLRQVPWPLASDEFDLVMVKDMSLATTNAMQQRLVDEYLRVLRPGGTLEVWESDHTIRMLRPHSPETPGGGIGIAPAPSARRADTDSDDSDEETDEEQDAAESLGAYVMTANTPLSAPQNTFLLEYNTWLLRALEARDLSPVPCTLIGPMLLQESEALVDVRSRRLAVPLSDVRWEREGVGGVVTKDGKTYVESGSGRGKGRMEDLSRASGAAGGAGYGSGSRPGGRAFRKSLSAGQLALRRTALTTVVQQVQSLEPLLRETSGKSQDEWDLWIGKMMNDLMREAGTSWGDCLEVGAWWAKKRARKG